MISSTQNEEMSSGNDKKMKLKWMAVAAGILAMIAKIWLRLRKFRNHSENFAILAKFSLCEIFARLAKFTVHCETSHFRYLCGISLG